MTTLPVYDGTNAQFIFDLLARSGIDTGGSQIKIRLGTGTVTFSASATSAAKTVIHGLGSTPVNIQLSPNGTTRVHYSSSNLDADSFDVTGYAADGTATGTFTFHWLAIG